MQPPTYVNEKWSLCTKEQPECRRYQGPCPPHLYERAIRPIIIKLQQCAFRFLPPACWVGLGFFLSRRFPIRALLSLAYRSFHKLSHSSSNAHLTLFHGNKDILLISRILFLAFKICTASPVRHPPCDYILLETLQRLGVKKRICDSIIISIFCELRCMLCYR